jgi:hypothetical protein
MENRIMAEKRTALKKVDGESILKGIYKAVFTDGTEFSADVSQVNDEMRARFLQYGLKQKLDDSMAGCDTVEEALDEVKSTWEAILKGNWTIRVAGEGVEGGLFARAYAERHGISLADAKAKIGGLVEKNLKANQERNAGKKDAPEITERMVFNRIRDVALERDADLSAIYNKLKEARAKKAKARTDLEVDLG